MLKALGQDFFSVRRLPEPDASEVQEGKEIVVPAHLRDIVDRLRQICLGLSATEFYATEVPDLRGKVIHGESFRVFARIQLQKQAVKLTLPGGPTMILDAHSVLPDNVAEEIRSSHDRALLQLSE